MHAAHRYLLALGFAALSASSFGATTVYSSSASFLAATQPGAYTETFTGLTSFPPSSFASGSFGYTISAVSGLYSNGDFLGANQIGDALTISFTGSAVTAIGANFYATNLADAFQATSLTLTLSDATTVTFTPTSVTDSYRGFASTVAITSLTISAPAGSLYAGIDNLTVGVSAVPEPSTLALLGLGVGGVLMARRRKG